jgi:hypothetical protein
MSTPADGTAATTGAPASPPAISAEPPVGLMDLGVLVVVIGLAVWYLYRKLWSRRGGCAGCGKGSGVSCGMGRLSRGCADDKRSGGGEVRFDRSRKP